MRLRMLAATVVAAAVLVGLAAPASAHITADPGSAPQGGEITLVFRVPNEETSTNVTQVQIAFPTDHPLLGVEPGPIPGWTPKVTEVKLNPPVPTDDGPVSQVVSQITWIAVAGGGTVPGQFEEFRVLVQRLPTDTNQVVFPAIQTYSDGKSVAWIDPVDANHPNPDHPRPVLTLTPAGNAPAPGSTPAPTTTTRAGAPGTTVAVAKVASKSDVRSARRFGVTGLVVGALGLVVAIAALAGRRRH